MSAPPDAPSHLAWGKNWPTAYPRLRGAWTLRRHDRWAALVPESALVSTVDPRDDSKLPELRAATSLGQIIGYRIGRRAVVRTPDTFVKVVRPNRTERMVEAHEHLAETCPGIRTPHVLSATSRGRIELSTVAGPSLHQLLRVADDPAVRSAIGDVAAALAQLHDAPISPGFERLEADPTERWVEIVRRAEPDFAPELETIAASLPRIEPRWSNLTHGDLHDKNVLLDCGQVGVIDLDGLGVGSAEDDVANLAVHLELRSLQRHSAADLGSAARRALYDAYRRHRPLDMERIALVERHTWFRLGCLYRFRSRTRNLTPLLLRRSQVSSYQGQS